MTELIGGFAHSQIGRPAFDRLPDTPPEQDWDHQLIDPLAMLTAGWPQGPGSQMSGMQHLDVRFDPSDQGYFQQQQQHHLPSPNLGYPHSDMDTPSSQGYTEAVESYPAAQIPAQGYLEPHRVSIPMQSPHGSISGISPRQLPAQSPSLASCDGNPHAHMIRMNSAPEALEASKVASKPGQSSKHKGNSEDDRDYSPPNRGRGSKRQRIPHTAVERRYRENLNAHLEKLRQTVPSLAARKGSGGGSSGKGDGGEGVKPSKCEILHGAIEYIGTQDKVMAAKDKRIADLAHENANLRANLEQMQHWISRAGGH